jgi:hypothetical protein
MPWRREWPPVPANPSIRVTFNRGHHQASGFDGVRHSDLAARGVLEPVRNFLESSESVVILCPRARRFARGAHVDEEKSRSL